MVHSAPTFLHLKNGDSNSSSAESTIVSLYPNLLLQSLDDKLQTFCGPHLDIGISQTFHATRAGATVQSAKPPTGDTGHQWIEACATRNLSEHLLIIGFLYRETNPCPEP